ncbi:MAG: hypothetical protein H6829_07575 [Planctomycetes bacterium]|nr:hypothetical protein [Planctomycetota bacterium]
MTWLLPLLLLVAGLLSAQDRRVRYLEIGVTLDTPAGYQPLPIPRSERFLKLSFVRRQAGCPDPLTWSLFRAERSTNPGLTDEIFVEAVLQARMVGDKRDLTERQEYERTRLAFERGTRRGMLFGYHGETYSYYLVGEAPGLYYEDEARLWRGWADELRLQAPRTDERERAALNRRYAGSRLSDPERRIAARLSLVDGWTAYDGESYLFLVHGLRSDAWRSLDAQLMGVRRYLTAKLLTHDSLEPDAVGVVRLCKDRTEYLDFGGVPEASGYFSPRDDELVLYNGGDPGAMEAVLRHEAFHQYIYAALGGIAPHSWFDEGFGEFMASAEVGGSRVVDFQPLVHHQRTLADLMAEGGAGLVPLATFLSMPREEFYGQARKHYAQAWALVDFLMRSDYALRSSRGSDLVRTYITRLRQGWADCLQGVSAGSPIQIEALDQVREAALRSALQRLELDDLERAFEEYVRQLVAFVPR